MGGKSDPRLRYCKPCGSNLTTVMDGEVRRCLVCEKPSDTPTKSGRELLRSFSFREPEGESFEQRRDRQSASSARGAMRSRQARGCR